MKSVLFFFLQEEVRATSAVNVVGITQIRILVLKTGVLTRKYVGPSKDLRSLVPSTRILIFRKDNLWMMNQKPQVRTFVNCGGKK